MTRRLTLVAVLVLLLPTPAQADGTVALRITQAGFDWIAGEVASRVPHEVDLADREKELLECWGPDSTVAFEGAHVRVGDFELAMPIRDDELWLELRTDLTLTGTAVASAIGCLPLSASCDIELGAEDLVLEAAVEIDRAAEGAPVLRVSALSVQIDPEALTIALGECTGDLDDRVNPLLEDARDDLVGMIGDGLAPWADQHVQPLLDELVGQTFLVPIDRAEMDAAVTIRDLSLQGSAFELTTGVGLTARDVAACVPEPGSFELEEDHGIDFQRWDPSPFAVALSERLVDEALVAVWQAGRLCQQPREVAGLGGILPGIPEGVDLTLDVKVDSPPDAGISPEGLAVDLRDLEIGVTAVDGAGTTSEALFRGTIHAAASFDVDPATNGLWIVLGELDLHDLAMVEGSLPEGTDLDVFMREVVLPLGLEKYGEMRVLDAVLPVRSYWLVLNAVDYFDRSMAIVFELFRAPEDDTGDPETVVVERPEDVVLPGTQRVVVEGEDDLVPPRLIRFRVRVDDGEWEEPTFSPTFDVKVRALGLHTIYVQAMDLAGNLDPDPAKVTLEVRSGESPSHPDVLPPPEDEPEDAAPTATTLDEGGCGCRAAGSPSRSAPAWTVVGLGAAWLARRRQRTRRDPRTTP